MGGAIKPEDRRPEWYATFGAAFVEAMRVKFPDNHEVAYGQAWIAMSYADAAQQALKALERGRVKP